MGRSGGGGLLLAQIADQTAGDDDLALAGQEVMGDRDRAVLADLDLELVLALGDRMQPRDPPDLPKLGLVVIGLVLEEQRDDPLGDQVPTMDAREALRDHGTDAELSRRERRVLAARSLA